MKRLLLLSLLLIPQAAASGTHDISEIIIDSPFDLLSWNIVNVNRLSTNELCFGTNCISSMANTPAPPLSDVLRIGNIATADIDMNGFTIFSGNTVQTSSLQLTSGTSTPVIELLSNVLSIVVNRAASEVNPSVTITSGQDGTFSVFGDVTATTVVDTSYLNTNELCLDGNCRTTFPSGTSNLLKLSGKDVTTACDAPACPLGWTPSGPCRTITEETPVDERFCQSSDRCTTISIESTSTSGSCDAPSCPLGWSEASCTSIGANDVRSCFLCDRTPLFSLKSGAITGIPFNVHLFRSTLSLENTASQGTYATPILTTSSTAPHRQLWITSDEKDGTIRIRQQSWPDTDTTQPPSCENVIEVTKTNQYSDLSSSCQGRAFRYTIDLTRGIESPEVFAFEIY